MHICSTVCIIKRRIPGAGMELPELDEAMNRNRFGEMEIGEEDERNKKKNNGVKIVMTTIVVTANFTHTSVLSFYICIVLILLMFMFWIISRLLK